LYREVTTLRCANGNQVETTDIITTTRIPDIQKQIVNRLAQDDYFVKDDTLIYKRKNLTEMLERDEIFSVSREYGEGDGFNRIR
jgi:hypothetical protein